jgi:superfamily I DNA and/or RNA helicase
MRWTVLLVDSFIRRRLIEQKRKQRRADLVETWQNILFLDRDIKLNSLLQVEYASWHSDENNTVIRVELLNDINADELIPAGQLLLMPTKKEKTMSVGHYLRQEGKFLLISKLRDCNLNHIASAGKLLLDERQWSASWNRQRVALEAVVNERCMNPRLPDILLDPSQAGQSTVEEIEHFFNTDLDNYKKEVVAQSLSTKDLFLIQGPPGTGKTVVISEIIAQILSKKPKSHILLVSQSNVAVDNVLTKVGTLLPDARIVRIGREENIGQDVGEFFVDRRIADWVKHVRERTKKYLNEHREVSIEVKDLEEYLDFLQSTLKAVENFTEKANIQADKTISENLQILSDRFPYLKIEPTVNSLKNVAQEIQKEIENQKSPLELCLETWIKRVGTLEDFEAAYLQASSIVAGTCVGIAGKRSLPERFDWVIIDEAGRATPSEILIPLVRAEHGILVGDHKQLPPVIDHQLYKEASRKADIDPIWLKKSLFEYLYERLNKDKKAFLKIQYRMHPHIANLISSVFYHEEELQSGITAIERKHGWKMWNTAVVWFSTANWEDCFEGDEQGSKYNLGEARIILNQLQDLEKDVAGRRITKSVAVITGYRAQMDQLINQIEPQDRKKWRALSIEINTVDAFQGREEDIVFYSVVRNNKKKEIGFLGDCRRLNVSLSRARELLFVVGNHRMVSQAYVKEGINPFRDVIAHIVGHPAECTLME